MSDRDRFVAMVVVAGAGMGWFFLPHLNVRAQPDGSVVIDVQVLGKDFANASRIRITEVATETTMLDVRASGKFLPIWAFEPRPGTNGLDLDRTRTVIDVPTSGEERARVVSLHLLGHQTRRPRAHEPTIPHTRADRQRPRRG